MNKAKHILLVILSFLILTSLYFSHFKNDKNIKIGNFKQALERIDITKSPRGNFLSAWHALNSQYIDSTFNHQEWPKWKDRYFRAIKTKQDCYLAINTMLESLNDPYTRFLPPSEFEEQDRNIDAKLFGIGVHISKIKDNVVVVNVIEDTPAYKAKLKMGDIIFKVNDTLTKGLTLKEVAQIVRGKAGTVVNLTIIREKKELIKKVTREEIYIKSVKHKILENKYAYINLSSFISSDATEEMRQALKKTNNTQGLILDLRGNNGGLLPNAILISNMFLSKGTIVSIVDKNGNKQTIKAKHSRMLSTKPMVILINGGSASASEILSGALKENNRAKLVGGKTFGKGLVQKIHQLPDGSGINITVAKYLTPNGNDINKKGIEPDYLVKLTKKDFINLKDPQLDKAIEVLAMEVKKQDKKILNFVNKNK